MKTRNYKLLIAMILFAISPFGVVKGQTLCGNFAALQTAINNINNGTLTGDVVISLTGNIAMGTNTLTINASGTGDADYSSIKISTSATNRTISGTTNGAFFILDGADGVTFDGDAATKMKNITLVQAHQHVCLSLKMVHVTITFKTAIYTHQQVLLEMD